MKFYCQLDYEHISYPSPISINGNIANNGCGVCCASMVVEALCDVDFPIDISAHFSKKSGAREGFGTNMAILAPAIAKEFNLNVIPTLDTNEVKEFLRNRKGLVIANTIGNHDDWIGVFSDGRHYIVLNSLEDNIVGVWDPMYREGRYDIEGRKGKVNVDGFTAYADFSVIENDCLGKIYYMFYK